MILKIGGVITKDYKSSINKKDVSRCTCNENNSVKRVFRRVAYLSGIIFIYKGIRYVINTNDDVRDIIMSVFDQVSTESVVQVFSGYSLVVGSVLLGLGFLIKKKSFIHTKAFSYLLVGVCLDSLFSYLLPELPASIATSLLNIK